MHLPQIRHNPRHLIYLPPCMYQHVRNSIYLLAVCIGLYSCSGFEKIRKSSDVNQKLTKANDYYAKKDYVHANILYKELMPIMKSTRNYEMLFYKYAYSYYYMKDYAMASYYFKDFVDYFPTSKDAEECEYMSAVCLFKFAPKYSLDQTNGVKAGEALNNFVVKYPQSKFATEAQGYVAESQAKMELKQAEAAKLYYNMSQFQAAMVTYKSVMRNFPESKRTDEYLFMIMKSMYKYAKASIPSKQEERYANALSAWRSLKDGYPQSPYMSEAEKIYTETETNIKKIHNEQQ